MRRVLASWISGGTARRQRVGQDGDGFDKSCVRMHTLSFRDVALSIIRQLKHLYNSNWEHKWSARRCPKTAGDDPLNLMMPFYNQPVRRQLNIHTAQLIPVRRYVMNVYAINSNSQVRNQLWRGSRQMRNTICNSKTVILLFLPKGHFFKKNLVMILNLVRNFEIRCVRGYAWSRNLGSAFQVHSRPSTLLVMSTYPITSHGFLLKRRRFAIFTFLLEV
jgi:hypothetical protein